jgi:hypothetical protein
MINGRGKSDSTIVAERPRHVHVNKLTCQEEVHSLRIWRVQVR